MIDPLVKMSDRGFIWHVLWLSFFRCLPHPSTWRLTAKVAPRVRKAEVRYPS